MGCTYNTAAAEAFYTWEWQFQQHCNIFLWFCKNWNEGFNNSVSVQPQHLGNTHTHTQRKRILFTFKRTDCSLGSWPLSIGNHSTLSPDNSKGNGITVIKTEKRNSTTAGRRNIPQRQFCSDTLKFKWFKCTVAAQELLNNIYKISSSNGRKPEME